jgi:hypothetical protein
MEWYLEELTEDQRDRLLDSKLQRELEHQKGIDRLHQLMQDRNKKVVKSKKKKNEKVKI